MGGAPKPAPASWRADFRTRVDDPSGRRKSLRDSHDGNGMVWFGANQTISSRRALHDSHDGNGMVWFDANQTISSRRALHDSHDGNGHLWPRSGGSSPRPAGWFGLAQTQCRM